MNTDKHAKIASLLIDIEAEMRQQLLWSEERPTDKALQSEQPFCINTLNFVEWLQFVFIERMQALAMQDLPLPDKCDITPMAEEYFRGNRHQPRTLLALLQRIDCVLSG